MEVIYIFLARVKILLYRCSLLGYGYPYKTFLPYYTRVYTLYKPYYTNYRYLYI